LNLFYLEYTETLTQKGRIYLEIYGDGYCTAEKVKGGVRMLLSVLYDVTRDSATTNETKKEEMGQGETKKMGWYIIYVEHAPRCPLRSSLRIGSVVSSVPSVGFSHWS